MRKTSLLICVVGAAVFCGCAKYATPTGPEPQMTAAQRNFESLWQASLDTLRSMDFVIEKEDRRAGVITTKPLLGKHYIEAWRDDTGSAGETLESTINPIYHTVTVQMVKQGEDNFAPQVTVDVARQAEGGKQINSVSQAYKTLVLPGERKYARDIEEQEDLSGGQPLGESPKLAQKIREKILSRV